MRTTITGSLILAMVMTFASNARADVFGCVNNSSGEVKIVASCTVGTNASPCHHNDTCDLISQSSTVQRLSAEFQNAGGEIFTQATPAPSPVPPGAPGGSVVYDKTLTVPPGVAYITFSAQGDTHELLDASNTPIPGTGSALLMTASITDAAGNVTICQPMAGASGAAEFMGPWMTLIKLPDGETSPNNCNDGGGGTADCHDNAFSFSCCALVSPGPGGNNSRDVKINMASSNGAFVFYEDSTIYIDQTANNGNLCQSVGTAPH